MIQLTLNGKAAKFDGDPEMPLLWFVRDELQLTGTKFGCGMGLCGACTVHLNGEAIRSCVTPMKSAGGKIRHNHRGPVAEWRPPAAKGVEGLQRAAVRVLPERPDHAGRRHAEEDS